MPVALDDVNRMNGAEFIATLGAIFEGSPWVAERAFAGRPFASVEALHDAMTRVVREAAREAQLTLLRAHPDLAGKVTGGGAMSVASVTEQASVGLDRLTDADGERFDRLNRAYRERFGFPFIIAVRRHTRAAILDAFERRLTHTVDQEVDAALAQVFEITRLRLLDRIRP